jgi:uncharacterized membrane protein
MAVGRSPARVVARVALGAFLVFAGVGHLSSQREDFQAQVPDWVPLDPDLVVVASGVVEIVLGASLVLLARYRVALGWVVAAFFVAIFPGNISQYVDGDPAFGLDTDRARLIRLFLQPVLVAWALWCTGAWSAWRARRSAGPQGGSGGGPGDGIGRGGSTPAS